VLLGENQILSTYVIPYRILSCWRKLITRSWASPWSTTISPGFRASDSFDRDHLLAGAGRADF